MKSIISIITTTFLFLPLFVGAQSNFLKNIKELPSHPRILLTEGEEQQLKNNIAMDSVWTQIHQSIINECDKIITKPVLERRQHGRRLLSVSREAIRRIFYLAYAYRMERQEKYLQHAEKEMLAISAFGDWNPSHFLDVAEMTMAMGIGYDWLYNVLPTSSKETIRAAILKKGVDPSLNDKYNWFLKSEYNWNQVCNAGMLYGVLAIYEDIPELSKLIISRAIESIKLPMDNYAPDGAYPEGYGYWDYGTSFNIMFLSAIEKLFGTDYGLSESQGFMKTAGYMENMVTPLKLNYNYSDCGDGAGFNPAMFWFANKLNDLSLLWSEKGFIQKDRLHTGNRLLPAVLIWGSNVKFADIQPPKEMVWTGQGINPVIMMRTSWTDTKAIYLGFKGGTASSNHAHMDVGSFIMEAGGVRWASDFGMQDYHSLESKGIDLWNNKQNSSRWQIFRYNNFSHNTLTIDNKLHAVEGYADIRSYSSNPEFMNAISDLSKIFRDQLAECVRGVAIVNKQYVVVRDELKTLDKETTVRWTMLTSADAKITGKNSIELKKDGQKLKIQVIEPESLNVTMKTWTTTPPNDFDAPNPNTVLVGFEVKIPANTNAAFTVKLIPQNAKKTTTKIPELEKWTK
jgi:hypothetical protein